VSATPRTAHRGILTMALEILIVDDERDIRELVAGVLGDDG
jgi:hypothetical protein